MSGADVELGAGVSEAYRWQGLLSTITAVARQHDLDAIYDRVRQCASELVDAVRHELVRGELPQSPLCPHVLCLPITVDGRVEATLRLERHPDAAGFTSEDAALLGGLVVVAEAAVERARAHEALNRRERWLDALRATTAALLDGAVPREVLSTLAEQARTLVGADTATVALPARGDAFVLQVATGALSERMRDVEFPREGSLTAAVIDQGETHVSTNISADPRTVQPIVALGAFGPTMFVPLTGRGVRYGTLLVANLTGGRPFGAEDVAIVEAFAAQASLAYEYGRAREELERVRLLGERERIGRDLHESVVRRVSALALDLEGAVMRLGGDHPDLAAQLTSAVDTLDQALRDLRTAVFAT